LAPRCKSPWTEARISGCEWFQKLTSSLRRCSVGVIADSRKGFTQTLFAFEGQPEETEAVRGLVLETYI